MTGRRLLAVTLVAAAPVAELSYLLLMTAGAMPDLYSQTGRYPANFLIDRDGRLHEAPSADEPFFELEAAVDAFPAAGAASDRSTD